MVTGASTLPHCGSASETGTFASACSGRALDADVGAVGSIALLLLDVLATAVGACELPAGLAAEQAGTKPRARPRASKARSSEETPRRIARTLYQRSRRVLFEKPRDTSKGGPG